MRAANANDSKPTKAKSQDKLREEQADQRTVLRLIREKGGSIKANTRFDLLQMLGLNGVMSGNRFSAALTSLVNGGRLSYARRKLDKARTQDNSVRPITYTIIKRD